MKRSSTDPSTSGLFDTEGIDSGLLDRGGIDNETARLVVTLDDRGREEGTAYSQKTALNTAWWHTPLTPVHPPSLLVLSQSEALRKRSSNPVSSEEH